MRPKRIPCLLCLLCLVCLVRLVSCISSLPVSSIADGGVISTAYGTQSVVLPIDKCSLVLAVRFTPSRETCRGLRGEKSAGGKCPREDSTLWGAGAMGPPR